MVSEQVRGIDSDFYWPVIIVFGGNFLFFFWCQWVRDNSWIDVMWGQTFVTPILGLILKRYLEGGPTPDLRSWIVLGLVSVWAMRLSIHIATRHKGEDFRYQDWRREWMGFGYWGYLWRALVIVFMLQAFFSLIVNSATLYIEIYSSSQDLVALDYAGIALWLFGFLFEWVGDEQLKRHLADS